MTGLEREFRRFAGKALEPELRQQYPAEALELDGASIVQLGYTMTPLRARS
jgi:hypothetical protein